MLARAARSVSWRRTLPAAAPCRRATSVAQGDADHAAVEEQRQVAVGRGRRPSRPEAVGDVVGRRQHAGVRVHDSFRARRVLPEREEDRRVVGRRATASSAATLHGVELRLTGGEKILPRDASAAWHVVAVADDVAAGRAGRRCAAAGRAVPSCGQSLSSSMREVVVAQKARHREQHADVGVGERVRRARRPRHSVLIGTTMAPRRQAPKAQRRKSGPIRHQECRTRVPLPRRAPASAEATRRASAARSA